MDILKELRAKYPDDVEFNDNLNEYLTCGNIAYEDYTAFLESFVPLMADYPIDEYNTDAIISMIIHSRIGNFINKKLPDYIMKALNNRMLRFEIILKTNTSTINFLNTADYLEEEERVRKTDDDHNQTHGINYGKKTVIDLFYHYTTQQLMKTIIHESLHQVTFKECTDYNNYNDILFKKTGIYIKEKIVLLKFFGTRVLYKTENSKKIHEHFRNLNEAITEYLTKKSMGDLYPIEYASYEREVKILEELIEEGILDDDIIVKAYTTNCVKLIIDRVLERTGNLEPLERFDNGYTPKSEEQFIL